MLYHSSISSSAVSDVASAWEVPPPLLVSQAAWPLYFPLRSRPSLAGAIAHIDHILRFPDLLLI